MNSLQRMALAIVLALPTCRATAQDPQDSTATFWTFGIAGGVNIPTGGWSEHPYARGVKQFGSAWTGSAEIAVHTSRRFSLAIIGSYAPLATDDWTEYAASQGDRIESSASLGMVLLALRPRPYTDGVNAITIELAGGVLFTSGKESFGSFNYEYTFLPGVSATLEGGIEYERWISAEMAIFVRGTYAFGLADLEYGDGRTSALCTAPIIAGLRLRL